MTIDVFLGPSLRHHEAQTLMQSSQQAARILPPCKMGDVYLSVQRKPTAIVIIDGFFERTPAVWHKEILFALEQGIPVYGGSSMGALRAAELHTLGMRGIGRIFQQFASGDIEDDDEVAVSHLDADMEYQCLSEAMVNIRFGVSLAVEQQVISHTSAEKFLAFAKAQYYPLRSWFALFEYGQQAENGVDQEEMTAFKEWINNNDVDLKKQDAITTLNQVANDLASSLTSNTATMPVEPLKVERTVFWEHMVLVAQNQTQSQAQNQTVSPRLLEQVKLFSLTNTSGSPIKSEATNTSTINTTNASRDALHMVLVEELYGQLPLQPVTDAEALKQFRYRHNLLALPDLKRYLQTHQLSQNECLQLAKFEAKLMQLARFYRGKTEQRLPLALKYQQQYAEIMQRLNQKWQRLQQLGIDSPSSNDVKDIDSAFNWFKTHAGLPASAGPDFLTEEMGFESRIAFINAMVGEYLSQQEEQYET